MTYRITLLAEYTKLKVSSVSLMITKRAVFRSPMVSSSISSFSNSSLSSLNNDR